MPQKIPLPVLFSRSTDDSALPDMVGARLINGYVDKIDNASGFISICKTPGMDLVFDLSVSSQVDGLFWWDANGWLIAVCNGRIFKLTTVNGNFTEITGDALTVIGPVSFATDGAYLMMASGGRIVCFKDGNITAPGACTATLQVTGAGALTNGDYKYKITFVNDTGETEGGTVSNTVTVDGTHNKVDLSAIPVCTDGYCTARNIYRTEAGGSDYYLVDTLSDNTTTIYEDNIADASLGAAMPTTGTAEYQTFYLADADAPTAVSHVAYIDSYFLANSVGTGYFYWSDVGDPLSWSAVSFANAESGPDNIIAMHISNREITFFGKETIEIWYNDGVTPFSRLDGAFVQVGCGAANSIINAGGVWAWMNDDRRMCLMQGRQPQIISGTYDDAIRDIRPVSDCMGNFLSIGKHAFCVWTFPTIRQTFLHDLTTGVWTEWGVWDSDSGEYKSWAGTSIQYAKSWDETFIGGSDGLIYKVNANTFQNNGEQIRTLMRTGWVSHGSMDLKSTQELRVRCKRGAGGLSGDEPTFSIRWRNEDHKWSDWKQISLGKIGDENSVRRLMRVGYPYRMRQYEIEHTANSGFVLSDLEEILYGEQ